MCDFINTHEDLIAITSFGEYRAVMKKVMVVIQEAHSTERKRRQTSRKKKSDEVLARRQRAKALIQDIRRKGIGKEEIERRFEEIYGSGSRQEIEEATTREKDIERIEEVSKREEQFEVWENMRQESRRRQ